MSNYSLFLINGHFADSEAPYVRLDNLTYAELETMLKITSRQIENMELVIRRGEQCK